MFTKNLLCDKYLLKAHNMMMKKKKKTQRFLSPHGDYILTEGTDNKQKWNTYMLEGG